MEPFIGQIIMFGGNFAPRGWALCDGTLLSISQYQALFSILGTTYGGDGRTTFALPDLRGRVAIHEGTGPGLRNRRLGEKGGVEEVTLTTTQIPSHNHTAVMNGSDEDADSDELNGNFLANHQAFHSASSQGVTLNGGAISVGNTGGSQGHTNMQPYTVVNYIIALTGTYPSRD